MEMCFGAAWEVYVQGASLAWERVFARRGERGKTPVAARIPPPAAFLPPKRSSVPSFRSPNVAPCRVIAAQTPPAAAFLQGLTCINFSYGQLMIFLYDMY